MFPVLEGDSLKGCVTTREVKKVPREEWSRTTVGDIARTCSSENTIEPEADAMKALSRMNKTGSSRLMVTEGQKLAGIVTLKDLMRFLSVKVDLEEE